MEIGDLDEGEMALKEEEYSLWTRWRLTATADDQKRRRRRKSHDVPPA